MRRCMYVLMSAISGEKNYDRNYRECGLYGTVQKRENDMPLCNTDVKFAT